MVLSKENAMPDHLSEILPFCPQGDVSLGEVMDLAAYKADVQRLRGNQPGIARLELVNMALRQTSHVAAGVAQFIARRHAAGVRDDADLDALEDGLAAAVNALRAPTRYRWTLSVSVAENGQVTLPSGSSYKVGADAKLWYLGLMLEEGVHWSALGDVGTKSIKIKLLFAADKGDELILETVQ